MKIEIWDPCNCLFIFIQLLDKSGTSNILIGEDFEVEFQQKDDFPTSSNENESDDEEEIPGEVAVCVPIISSPPRRRSSRARRKPIRFAEEYNRYYK